MGKSVVVSITQREIRAKRNWQRRRARPTAVPGMPGISFILTLGGATLAPSVIGGASTGCTDGRLKLIATEKVRFRFTHREINQIQI